MIGIHHLIKYAHAFISATSVHYFDVWRLTINLIIIWNAVGKSTSKVNLVPLVKRKPCQSVYIVEAHMPYNILWVHAQILV